MTTSPLVTRPVNWNRIEHDIDLEIWNHITSNFWLDTRIPISGDLQSWSRFTEAEKTATIKVFAGLTTLDTIQATVGAISLIPDAYSQHEEAIYTYVAMQESVHAKSYSSIFATLCSTKESDEAFEWAINNEFIQRKAEIVQKYYRGDDPLKRRIASTLLESFLFYSGFYLPFYFSSRARLTNTADLIRLIVADEAVHGFYIGNRFQYGLAMESEERQEELLEFTYDLLMELYDNEIKYTQHIYDPLGLTEDASAFLRYNANKALMNLGYDPLFPKDTTEANPAIIASLSLGSETHDFFSGAGSSYVMAKHQPTVDADWDFASYGYGTPNQHSQSPTPTFVAEAPAQRGEVHFLDENTTAEDVAGRFPDAKVEVLRVEDADGVWRRAAVVTELVEDQHGFTF